MPNLWDTGRGISLETGCSDINDHLITKREKFVIKLIFCLIFFFYFLLINFGHLTIIFKKRQKIMKNKNVHLYVTFFKNIYKFIYIKNKNKEIIRYQK